MMKLPYMISWLSMKSGRPCMGWHNSSWEIVFRARSEWIRNCTSENFTLAT